MQKAFQEFYIYTKFFLVTTERCPPINAPSNGGFYIIDDRQTTLFICNSGYTIVGSANVSCVDGTWDSSPPICKL